MHLPFPAVGQCQIVLLHIDAFMIPTLEQSVVPLTKPTAGPVRQRLDYLLALLTISVAPVLLQARLVG